MADSPLWQINLVTWNDDVTPRELTSGEEITAAEQNGDLSINQTDIIGNHLAIQWQNDSLMIREVSESLSSYHLWYFFLIYEVPLNKKK